MIDELMIDELTIHIGPSRTDELRVWEQQRWSLQHGCSQTAL